MSDAAAHSTSKLLALCSLVGTIAAAPGFWAWLSKPETVELAEVKTTLARLEDKIDKVQTGQAAQAMANAEMKADARVLEARVAHLEKDAEKK